MKTFKRLLTASSCVALMIGFSANAKADAWNKKTFVSINGPIQVLNTVLDAGHYVFKLADSQSDRHIVQIFNADESRIITTILAIPNYRLTPRGRSVFSFWETPAGEAPALRAWFYPGDNFGQEFQYEPVQLARITSHSASTTTFTEPAQIVKEERTEETVIAQSTVPAQPEPVPAPAAEPEPAQVSPQPAPEPAQQTTATYDSDSERVQADRPTELPHTGSYYPLIALAGLMSLGGFVVTGLASRNRL